MKKTLFACVIAIAVPLYGCAIDDSTDEHRQDLGDHGAHCSNTSPDPCGCDTDDDCPTGTVCQVTDATPPPWAGVCIPAPPCDSNTDPSCPPPPPPSGCNNTNDPNCEPPPPSGCTNTTDPNCT